MLGLLGLITILGLLGAILSKRVSPLVALVAFPVAASLVAGFGLRTGRFMIEGIQGISGVIGMFVFAILFFGVMTDARMLEPVIGRLLRLIGNRPSRIVPGSALLALLVHLDGSGAVCFLVTVPALLPLYQRVGIDRRILACVTSLAAGVNFLPWTGPTLRASAALHISTTSIFTPLVGVQAVGLAFVFGASLFLGITEERRLGREHLEKVHREHVHVQTAADALPRHFYLNLVLTAIVLGVMVSGKVDPAVIFMLGTVIALTLNFPSLKSQQARLAAHAPAAILMASILFAAGSFTGIMKGTGMLNAMAA
ncbi:MAG TPA: SLC13 family permease, partial [Silvibacterium sp.]|nr:SLC13 family permease [Silvibacterium sp.]